ncbi:MAG TPA: hypothetical protein VGG33_10305, partial [Polyangia bacterium]
MSARKETRSELGTALLEAERAPHKEEHWVRLEEIASTQQRPDEVAELYRRVLQQSDRPELAIAIGPRAVRFHEEWFGGKADELGEILTRVLELDPSAEWALRRLSVLLTVKERWGDLLALYDRALAAETNVSRRRELLSEALRIAKDFIGDADRTVEYLGELVRLSPHDQHLFGQLERLLERQGRHVDLAQLLRSRAATASPAEARRLRERTALLYLDRLGDPASALAEIGPALSGSADDAGATAVVDRILRSSQAPVEVRTHALELIRARFEASGESEPIIEALKVALDFSGPAEQIAIHRELVARMTAIGDRRGAIRALIVLLGLEPGASDAAEQLRHLAELEGDPRPYLQGLDAASAASPDPDRRVELWSEAARIAEEAVGDPALAVGYYRNILNEAGATPDERMLAGRKLSALLSAHPEAAASPEERLMVVERLADDLGGAPKTVERRAVLSEVARLSEASGNIDRAAGALTKLLEIDPNDEAALDALIALYERGQRWEPLVAALRRRASLATTSLASKRADLVRVAGVEAAELGQPAAAIGTWLEIEKAF